MPYSSHVYIISSCLIVVVPYTVVEERKERGKEDYKTIIKTSVPGTFGGK